MANTVIFNGSEFKSATAVKAQARIDVMEVITNALRAAYGDDKVAKVGSNEFGVIVGEVIDKDGFPQDVVTTVKPTVKEWESRKTDKRVYEQFILADVAQAYEMEVKEKEEKKEKERQEREEKKARDKKAREEKAKAEKEKEEKAIAEAAEVYMIEIKEKEEKKEKERQEKEKKKARDKKAREEKAKEEKEKGE